MALNYAEESLLTQYAQSGFDLECSLMLKFDFASVPINRKEVINLLKERFPGIVINGLSLTTVTTMWLLLVESKARKTELITAATIPLKEHQIKLIDFDVKNIIRLSVHRIGPVIPDRALVDKFSKFGKLTHLETGIDEDGIPTGVRNLTLDAPPHVKRDDIPDFVRINGIKGYVVVKGKEPTCHRCHKKGHVRRTCIAVKCEKCKRFGHIEAECRSRPWASLFQPVQLSELS